MRAQAHMRLLRRTPGKLRKYAPSASQPPATSPPSYGYASTTVHGQEEDHRSSEDIINQIRYGHSSSMLYSRPSNSRLLRTMDIPGTTSHYTGSMRRPVPNLRVPPLPPFEEQWQEWAAQGRRQVALRRDLV